MIAVPQDDVPSPQLEGSGTWFLWVVVDGSLPRAALSNGRCWKIADPILTLTASL